MTTQLGNEKGIKAGKKKSLIMKTVVLMTDKSLKTFPGYWDIYSFTQRESKREGLGGGGLEESVVCKWSAQKINYGQVTELFDV